MDCAVLLRYKRAATKDNNDPPHGSQIIACCTTYRIKLNGIDAPEKGQLFGDTAKVFMGDNIGDKIERVVTHGKDRYGRVVGDVYCPYRASMATVEQGKTK